MTKTIKKIWRKFFGNKELIKFQDMIERELTKRFLKELMKKMNKLCLKYIEIIITNETQYGQNAIDRYDNELYVRCNIDIDDCKLLKLIERHLNRTGFKCYETQRSLIINCAND